MHKFKQWRRNPNSEEFVKEWQELLAFAEDEDPDDDARREMRGQHQGRQGVSGRRNLGRGGRRPTYRLRAMMKTSSSDRRMPDYIGELQRGSTTSPRIGQTSRTP